MDLKWQFSELRFKVLFCESRKVANPAEEDAKKQVLDSSRVQAGQQQVGKASWQFLNQDNFLLTYVVKVSIRDTQDFLG